MTRLPVTRVFTNDFEQTAQARCECGWAGIERKAWHPSDDAWPETIARAEGDAIKHGRQAGHVVPAQHVVAVA